MDSRISSKCLQPSTIALSASRTWSAFQNPVGDRRVASKDGHVPIRTGTWSGGFEMRSWLRWMPLIEPAWESRYALLWSTCTLYRRMVFATRSMSKVSSVEERPLFAASSRISGCTYPNWTLSGRSVPVSACPSVPTWSSWSHRRTPRRR